MVVAKKVRLLTKNKKGQFEKNLDTAKVERERAVISKESVAFSEQTYKSTGLLWVIDEQATAERQKGVKSVKDDSVTLEFDGLTITEENIDQFITDNEIDLGKATSLKGKLAKVEKFIKQSK